MTHDWAKSGVSEIADVCRRRAVRGQSTAGVVVMSSAGRTLVQAYFASLTAGAVDAAEICKIGDLPVTSDPDQSEGWEIVWDDECEIRCGVRH